MKKISHVPALLEGTVECNKRQRRTISKGFDISQILSSVDTARGE